MARKIVWSKQALDERKKIFLFWNERNQSSNFSKKLHKSFNAYLELIARFPHFGRATQLQNVRFKIVDRDYAIIYLILKDEILVISVWYNRQNPEDLPVKRQ